MATEQELGNEGQKSSGLWWKIPVGIAAITGAAIAAPALTSYVGEKITDFASGAPVMSNGIQVGVAGSDTLTYKLGDTLSSLGHSGAKAIATGASFVGIGNGVTAESLLGSDGLTQLGSNAVEGAKAAGSWLGENYGKAAAIGAAGATGGYWTKKVMAERSAPKDTNRTI